MPALDDDFKPQYTGEIREALIMIEGDEGAFELLAHGWLADSEGGSGQLFALVRSLGTDRLRLLVHDTESDPHHPYSWHRMSREALLVLQNRIARMRVDRITPEAPRRSAWLVRASEKGPSRPTG
jgi:hypothetical protein